MVHLGLAYHTIEKARSMRMAFLILLLNECTVIVAGTVVYEVFFALVLFCVINAIDVTTQQNDNKSYMLTAWNAIRGGTNVLSIMLYRIHVNPTQAADKCRFRSSFVANDF